MQSVPKLDVPLVVEVGVGDNWDKAHKRTSVRARALRVMTGSLRIFSSSPAECRQRFESHVSSSGLAAAVLASVTSRPRAAVASLALTPPPPEVQFTGLSGESFATFACAARWLVVNFLTTWCCGASRKCRRRGSCATTSSRPRLRPEPAGVAFARTMRKTWRGSIARPVDGRSASRSTPRAPRRRAVRQVRLTPTTFADRQEGQDPAGATWASPTWAQLHQLVERGACGS